MFVNYQLKGHNTFSLSRCLHVLLYLSQYLFFCCKISAPWIIQFYEHKFLFNLIVFSIHSNFPERLLKSFEVVCVLGLRHRGVHEQWVPPTSKMAFLWIHILQTSCVFSHSNPSKSSEAKNWDILINLKFLTIILLVTVLSILFFTLLRFLSEKRFFLDLISPLLSGEIPHFLHSCKYRKTSRCCFEMGLLHYVVATKKGLYIMETSTSQTLGINFIFGVDFFNMDFYSAVLGLLPWYSFWRPPWISPYLHFYPE